MMTWAKFSMFKAVLGAAILVTVAGAAKLSKDDSAQHALDRLTFGAPRMAWDLPGGAPRLVQKADGYRHTFVAGVETVHDDEFTGELPGRLLRGPR